MKKTILIVVLMVMTTIGAMAQEKGPVVVETENFSVKVPKGWVVKKKSSGSISSVTLEPETAPKPSTNFGYRVELWSFAYKSYTVEKIIDEALHQYGENGAKKMEDVKFGDNTFQRTFFDEGHGSSQVLALPLTGEGALRVGVSSYALTDKNVKAILKSIKVLK